MIEPNTVHALTSLPYTDGNFTSSLNGATVNEIKEAIEIMENRVGNKTRIAACYLGLRKRSR